MSSMWCQWNPDRQVDKTQTKPELLVIMGEGVGVNCLTCTLPMNVNCKVYFDNFSHQLPS